MDLLEYQGQKLLRKYDIPVLNGFLVSNYEQVKEAVKKIGNISILKAQIPYGKRKKMGCIRTASSPMDAYLISKEMFNKKIEAHIVKQIFILPKINYLKEYYISFSVDNFQKRYLIIFSTKGGSNIENIAHKYPNSLYKFYVDPLLGINQFEVENLIKTLAISDLMKSEIAKVLIRLWNLVRTEDTTLAEINPLVVTVKNNILALDAKITLDDNALFRHVEKKSYFINKENHNKKKTRNHNKNIHYVDLNGCIGIIGNGAGLVMSTLDLVSNISQKYKYKNIYPGNFLDVKGGASRDIIKESIHLLYNKPKINSIFINIFAGITSCTTVACGIKQAIKDIRKHNNNKIIKPLVIRLKGNNAKKGNELLKKTSFQEIFVVKSLNEGAKKVIKLAKQYQIK